MRFPRDAWGLALLAGLLTAPALTGGASQPPAPTCPAPYRVTRSEMLRAMAEHGEYNLTATTTSLRFGAEALLELVRRRQRDAPGDTRLFIDHADWFSAHRETAGVTYAEMSEAARAAVEHHQDAVVDYGPEVVAEVVNGPAPTLALDVTISWPDSAKAPSSFTYRDTLGVPRVEVRDSRVVRFKLLAYDNLLVFDQVEGISVKPLGFLSAVFALVGKPDLQQTRLATSPDQWQVIQGRVKVFPGISKTGTAVVEPDGRGHAHAPPAREDLKALERRLKRPLALRYGRPSC